MIAISCRPMGGPFAIHVRVVPSAIAQRAVLVLSEAVDKINAAFFQARVSMVGYPPEEMLRHYDSDFVNWLWVHACMRPCPSSPSGYAWADPPLYPIAIVARGRPDVSPGVPGPRLSLDGSGGGTTNMLELVPTAARDGNGARPGAAGRSS